MTAYTKDAKFTAFIRYQWTSNNQGNKLHRVVIFRASAQVASRRSRCLRWTVRILLQRVPSWRSHS